MFIPSTFKRPVSSWKALNLRKTLLMASSVRLKPLKDRKSGSAGMPRPISYAVFCLKKKKKQTITWGRTGGLRHASASHSKHVQARRTNVHGPRTRETQIEGQ